MELQASFARGKVMLTCSKLQKLQEFLFKKSPPDRLIKPEVYQHLAQYKDVPYHRSSEEIKSDINLECRHCKTDPPNKRLGEISVESLTFFQDNPKPLQDNEDDGSRSSFSDFICKSCIQKNMPKILDLAEKAHFIELSPHLVITDEEELKKFRDAILTNDS